jgi:hypothetical protein
MRAFLMPLLVLSRSAVPVAISGSTAPPKKPNMILVLTDDQDLLLGGLEPMPKTRKWLQQSGATLTNYFVNTPICCPSRSEYVSGRYYHNHGAPNGNCMHVDAEAAVFGTDSIFVQLQGAGYATGVFGKVTNDQTSYFCPAHEDPNEAEWRTEPHNVGDGFLHATGNNVLATACNVGGTDRCHDAGTIPSAAACQGLCETNRTCLWYTYGAAHKQCWLGSGASWQPWKNPSAAFPSACKPGTSFPGCKPPPPPARGRADGMSFVNAPCDYNDFWASKYFRSFPNGSQYWEELATGPGMYQTSQMGNRSTAWIKEMIAEKQPFFAWSATTLPPFGIWLQSLFC